MFGEIKKIAFVFLSQYFENFEARKSFCKDERLEIKKQKEKTDKRRKER